MGSGHISTVTETQVVALLARGDKHEDIRVQTGVSLDGIRLIKIRNKENLAIIKQKTLEKQIENADLIKAKANTKLSKRLDRDDTAEAILAKANKDYLDDTITLKEFTNIMHRVKELSITELVQVSKEMHHQSVETDTPKDSAADMAALIEAIRSGDEVSITKAVFNANNIAPPDPSS